MLTRANVEDGFIEFKDRASDGRTNNEVDKVSTNITETTTLGFLNRDEDREMTRPATSSDIASKLARVHVKNIAAAK